MPLFRCRGVGVSFLTPLNVQSLPDGRWRLIRPLIYVSDEDEVISVPVDYTTDLFSVPRPLWWLFPRDGKGRAAAVVHDYIYTDGTDTYTRGDADRIFRNALSDKGVKPFHRWVMWAGVRIGGRGNW